MRARFLDSTVEKVTVVSAAVSAIYIVYKVISETLTIVYGQLPDTPLFATRSRLRDSLAEVETISSGD